MQHAQIDRPIMVPIAGFSTKSTLFIIYLQFVHISSFFQIFPKTCVPDRETWTAPYAHISLASAARPADDRERPCFRPVPAYANFLLLLAAFYMRFIFPESAPPIGKPGNRKLINSPRFFICFISHGKLSRRGT